MPSCEVLGESVTAGEPGFSGQLGTERLPTVVSLPAILSFNLTSSPIRAKSRRMNLRLAGAQEVVWSELLKAFDGGPDRIAARWPAEYLIFGKLSNVKQFFPRTQS